MLDYRPDLDPRTQGVLTRVDDMVPTARGYRSAYKAFAHTATTHTPASNETYISALFATRWLSTPGGIVIAGTNRKLYVYNYSSGLINISRAGDYNLTGQTFQAGEPGKEAFDICAFGDIIIACNKAETTQTRSALDLSISTLFANHANAPKASTCCTALNFLFHGDCASWSTVTGSPDILAWSAIGDYTSFAVNPTVTQSSYAQFNDTPGAITAVRPFRDGIVVFKADSMYLGRYVGAGGNSPIWDFVRISDKVGCMGPQQVTSTDEFLIFIGKDDVYSFDGTRPLSITDGIRSAMIGDFGFYGGGTRPMIIGHDKPHTQVWINDRLGGFCWVYDYRAFRWGRMSGTAPITTNAFCQTNTNDFRSVSLSSVSAGVQSYSETDNHYGLYTLYFDAGSPKNRNGETASEHSAFRSVNGTLYSQSYGTANTLSTFSTITPVFGVRPNGVTNATLTPYTCATPTSDGTALTAVTMDAKYRFDILQSGATDNYVRFKLAVVEDFELMDWGIDAKPAGKR